MRGISSADVDTVILTLEEGVILASDDLRVRGVARALNIPVTGSVGILKMLYTEGRISSTDEMISLLKKLGEDLYIPQWLFDWALKE